MAAESQTKFGAFRGVFVPSILTILGVIMYLRLGWVVGNVGLYSTLFIVTLSSAITFLTALSMSATATNMKVGVGGAYYMISRSFGVEAGAAVGLPLYLAQALGISFYIAGFAEAVHAVVPVFSEKVIGVVSLVLLAVVAYRSANAALKIQLVVFTLIILSLISFFMGSPPPDKELFDPELALPPVGFWVAFAVFFPAVTGIEAGMALSGDLKHPGKSLPLGTLAAVLTGYAVYMALPFFLDNLGTPAELRANPSIMKETALVEELVLLGVWAATLSSALGAMLGAPRTLQALGSDRIVPVFFGKGSGGDNNPRIATAFTFVVALGGIVFGDLNLIAPILSMFFLTSYGFLNLSAFVEDVLSTPSWRPTFRTPWYLSLLGALACLMTMLMINPGATFVAGFSCVALFFFTTWRNLNARWSDVRRGLLAFLAKTSIYGLSRFKTSEHTWRPHILVLCGSLKARWYMVELADAITHSKGFLTIASVLPRDQFSSDHNSSLEKSTKSYLEKRKIAALTKFTYSDDPFDGAKNLMENYGIGALTPNTLLMGESEELDRILEYSRLIRFVHDHQKNLVIVRKPDGVSVGDRKRIDVWWGGQNQNAGFMLALAHLLQTSPEWRGSSLCLNTTVKHTEDQEKSVEGLETYIEDIRVRAEARVHVDGREDSMEILQGTIRSQSKDSDLVFIGLRAPEEDESDESYCDYYREILRASSGLPQTAIVMASEPIDFKAIFD